MPHFKKIKLFLLYIIIPFLTNAQTTSKELDHVQCWNASNVNSLRNQLAQLEESKHSDKLNIQIQLSKHLFGQDCRSLAIDLLKNAVTLSKPFFSSPDTTLARACHELGVLYYNDNNSLAAIDYWQIAVDLRKDFFHSRQNHPEIIRGLRNIGTAYLQDELEYENARKYLQKALILSSPNSDSRHSIDTILLERIYRDLAFVELNSQDFDKAEDYLMLALNTYLDHPNKPNAFIELGDIYSDLFSFSQEISDKKKMIEYALLAKSAYSSGNNDEGEYFMDMISAYQNLGAAYLENDSIQKALEYSQEALSYFHKLNDKTFLYLIAPTYSNLSIIYRLKNEYTKAMEMVDQSIEIDKADAQFASLADNLDNKAEIFLAQNNWDSALVCLNQALNITLDEQLDIYDPYILPVVRSKIMGDRPRLITLLYDKAKILKGKAIATNSIQDLQIAAATFDTISTLIDQIRINLEADGSKTFLAQKAKQIFELGIEINDLLFHQTQDKKYLSQAFGLLERSKAVILLDAVKESRAKFEADIPEIILEKEYNLKSEIAELERKISKQAIKSNLRIDLLNKKRSLTLLVDSLKRNYPKYYALKYNTEVISHKKIPLQKDQKLIEYFVGNNYIFIFVIGQNLLKLKKIKKDFPLNDWAKGLLSSIYSFPLENDQYSHAPYANTAFHLYQKLIAPIENWLSTQIILVPDGVLGYIPFDALLSKQVSKSQLSNYRTYPYLWHRYQISYSYSASLLKEMSDRQIAPTSKNLLAIAPNFSGHNNSLGKLKNNKIEVQSIKKILNNGKLLLDEKATKKDFCLLASQFKILHLSTHGKAHDDEGANSYLAFSTTKDSLEEALLHAWELYNLNLNAELVVLSACETGIGQLQQGEGIISLARGFSYAGSKSIITTLWKIVDSKDTSLYAKFYTNLKMGLPKDKALHQAKKEYIENSFHDRAHPFFWAGHIPIGDMKPIALGGNKLSWIWLLAILSLSSLMINWFIKKAR